MNLDYQPQDQPAYDPHAKVSNELSVMQPGERIVCKIKRHPVGVIGAYILTTIFLALVGVLAFAVAPSVVGEGNTSQATQFGAVAFLICVVIALVYNLIATTVYWGNSWIVTSDSVTQIAQSSLFNRQSSQLALVNIEDVTAEQNGMLAHMLNYGVLKAETAGHQGKFVFQYCPNPNLYAQQILMAREAAGPTSHHPQSPQPPAGPPSGQAIY